MNTNTVTICFSPTGGTRKVAGVLAKELGGNSVNVDLTDRKADFSDIALNDGDTAIIAVPSYSGRVPATAAERLSLINGNGAKAVIVCVYGNRAYEDTLVELQDIAQNAGFTVIAAVAAIAEHSIVREFAENRPDTEDCRQLEEFAGRIRGKLEKMDFTTPAIPGNRPYRKAGSAGMVPKAMKDCTKCGICATGCPVGAIDGNDPTKVDSKLCISCMRCVSICPHKARKVSSMMLGAVRMMLKKACSTRKECELYL